MYGRDWQIGLQLNEVQSNKVVKAVNIDCVYGVHIRLKKHRLFRYQSQKSRQSYSTEA